MTQNSQTCRNLRVGDGLVANNLTNNVRQIENIFSRSAIFIFLFFTILIPQDSYSIELKQRQFGASVATGAASGGYEVPGTEGMSEMEAIQTLRHDIQLLDEEIMKCDRKRKGWIAATVVGGVGVVGTGVAAIVQNSKIQDKKSELKQVKSDLDSTKQDVREAKQRFDDMNKK